MELKSARSLSELADHAAREIKARLADLGSPDLPLDFEVKGDGRTMIRALCPVEAIEPGGLTFAVNRSYLGQVEASAAAAVILPAGLESERLPFIRVHEPRLVFTVLMELALEPHSVAPAGPDQVVFKDRASVEIGPGAVIGAQTYIGARVKIGAGTVVYPQVYIDDDVEIGDDCLIYPKATLLRRTTIGRKVILHSGVVVGGDGFGYNQVYDFGRGRMLHVKNAHAGGVVIEDYVELGPGTTVDQGLAGPTVIGTGTKIDNQVQVAHNVHIGRDCIIAAQTGLAGHAELGNQVIMFGQSGVTQGTKVGDGAIITAKAGVSTDIPPGQAAWAGRPAAPADQEWKRLALSRRELPRLREFFRLLKKASSFDELKAEFFSRKTKEK